MSTDIELISHPLCPYVHRAAALLTESTTSRPDHGQAPVDFTATFAQPAAHALLYVLPSAPHTGL